MALQAFLTSAETGPRKGLGDGGLGKGDGERWWWAAEEREKNIERKIMEKQRREAMEKVSKVDLEKEKHKKETGLVGLCVFIEE